MYLLTPKISMLAATPANSLTVFARLAMSRMPRMAAAQRTPMLSRIRLASPLPVTIPRRALISWTIISASVTISQHPQQAIAVAGAGDGIGRDAAGVVVDIGGDDPRADDGRQDQ